MDDKTPISAYIELSHPYLLRGTNILHQLLFPLTRPANTKPTPIHRSSIPPPSALHQANLKSKESESHIHQPPDANINTNILTASTNLPCPQAKPPAPHSNNRPPWQPLRNKNTTLPRIPMCSRTAQSPCNSNRCLCIKTQCQCSSQCSKCRLNLNTRPLFL